MAHLRLEKVHKSYGHVPVVRGIDLDIPDGEFTVLLGPSGCGKSTLLRVIAGLEDADDGEIVIDGQSVNDVRPRDRDVAMVFQNYALYPYMSVYENIAFGMRIRKMPEDEIRSQIAWAAKLLEIEELLQRAPRQLSGGQRQRVAMGRAMVRKPRLFLFDEPLSNLDAQLREGMRTEIKRLHQALRITTIYVTHDQVEAMTLADRVVLMNQGVVEQQGPPMELYERPASRFVASFLGSPPINYLDAQLLRDGDAMRLQLPDQSTFELPRERAARLAEVPAQPVTIGLRPDHFVLRHGVPGASVHVGISLLQPAGPRVFTNFELAGVPMMAEFSAREGLRQGDVLDLGLDLAQAVILDPGSGRALGR